MLKAQGCTSWVYQAALLQSGVIIQNREKKVFHSPLLAHHISLQIELYHFVQAEARSGEEPVFREHVVCICSLRCTVYKKVDIIENHTQSFLRILPAVLMV
jgi:hypothetical protein